MTNHDYFHPCAGLEHLYWHYSLWYCHHRQQWIASAHSYLETGTDADPVDLRQRRLDFGPFDTVHDARAIITKWLTEDLARWSESPPRPSGS